MRNDITFALLAIALLFATTGCGVWPHTVKDANGKTVDVPRRNIVMANSRGLPVDPTGNIWCQPKEDGWCNGLHTSVINYDVIPWSQFEDHMEELLGESLVHTSQKEKTRKIFIFIHGGLNTQVETVERAAKLQQKVKDKDYFPIFVNWQSSLVTSYKDHLLHIRQGEYWGDTFLGGLMGWITAPFYLLGDVARGIANLPIDVGLMVRSDVSTDPLYRDTKVVGAQSIGRRLFCDYDAAGHNQEHGNEPKCDPAKRSLNHIPIWIGRDDRTHSEMTVSGGKYLITFPTKLAISPLLDAAGTSSWDSMLRARSMLFRIENEYGKDGLLDPKRKGVMLALMEKMEALAKEKSLDLDITVVGHSMGAIVMNELIRRFPHLPFNHIIYMAAATSIRDYEDTIFFYLRQNWKAQVYHLVLHEASEAREAWDTYTPGIDLPPRGSLLVWIDDFLANPAAPLDRTVGRFTNLVPALEHTDNDTRDRIHVKAFRAGERAGPPLKHSEFTDPFHFWDSRCWEPKYDDKVFTECVVPLKKGP